ncbi:hypothetical protein RyT2_23700 [Pseudolactococcus yaeyamensis]
MKKVFLIVLSIFVCIIVIFNILDDKEKIKKSVKKIEPTSTAVKRVENNSQAAESSDSSTATTESSSLSDQDGNLKKETIIKTYLTIKLDKDVLIQRQKDLESNLTTGLYRKLNIEQDTATLVTMIKDWEEKKILNTNMSVQLLSQEIQEITFFEDVENDNNLMVQVTLKLTSLLSSNASKMSKIYSVKFSGDDLSDIELLSGK